MKFTKMQGLGNDYIYVDCMKETVEDPSAVAIKVSDRHFGVGSDGLILVKASQVADYRMEIYNADGSVAEMCGNGIRCVGKFLHDNGYVKSDSVSIETGAGVKLLNLIIDETGVCVGARVDMGEPILEPAKIPVRMTNERVVDEEIKVGGKKYHVTCVSMGNPHAVVFVDDIESLPLELIGPLFENHPVFPARINTEFVKIIDKNTVNMRVWERGSGETMACGTGACAVVVASVLNKHCDRNVTVNLRGGQLKILWDEKTNRVFMEGPATTVCKGEY